MNPSTRTLISDDKDIKVEKFKLIMTFQFVDLEATVDDLHLNPLGFQVSYYRVNLEDNVLQKNNTKVFDNNIKTDTIKDTIKDNINDY